MLKSALSIACLGFTLLFAVTPAYATLGNVSVHPSTPAEGLSGDFALSVGDSLGASDVANMNMLVNSSFDGATGCWLYFDAQQRQIIIHGDNGWGTASSYCSASVKQIVAGSTSLSVTFTIQFSAAWAGDKTLWARASDLSGNDSGYQATDNWTVSASSAPDFTVSAYTSFSQTVVAGNSAEYNLQLTAVNGYQGTIAITTQLTGPGASSISVGGFKSATLPITVVNPPLQSTIVTISLSTSTATTPGTVTATANFSDGTITHVVTLTLIVKPYSTPSVSVAFPSQNSSNFTVTATDSPGFQTLGFVGFLMNSSLSGTNGCWLVWMPAPNAADGSGSLAIASDDTKSWTQIPVGPLPNVAALANSQCSLPAGAVTSTGSGATLTLQFALQFSSLFTGTKTVYADAWDGNGPTTGYVPQGTWNATAGYSAPDFQIAVTPGLQSIAAGGASNFSATVSPFAGFTGTVSFNVTGLPPNALLTPPAPVGPGTPSQFSIQTVDGEPPNEYAITVTGTSGNLTHSAQVQLNVYRGVPSAWFGGPSGNTASPTSPYAFLYLSTDPLGYQNVSSLDILLNNTVNGQNACWIYFDGIVPWLASDDAAVWTRVPGGTGTAANSQCAVNFRGIVPGAYFGLSLVISFKPGFAPMHLYEDAVNRQGGDSGYLLQSNMPTSAPN